MERRGAASSIIKESHDRLPLNFFIFSNRAISALIAIELLIK